jgi:LA2681-like HEPN
LLDKIAGFLNAYLNLSIDPERVTIRNLWHNKQALRHQFETRPNWHLRGLYWLSRDVADDHDEDAKGALEPDARDLKKLRHTLEHRCLTVRDIDLGDDMGIVETMSLKTFEAKAMKLLKLVRAAIIHLALAVNYEERDVGKQESALWMRAYLPIYRRATTSGLGHNGH